jgi:hypothetical protein
MVVSRESCKPSVVDWLRFGRADELGVEVSGRQRAAGGHDRGFLSPGEPIELGKCTYDFLIGLQRRWVRGRESGGRLGRWLGRRNRRGR